MADEIDDFLAQGASPPQGSGDFIDDFLAGENSEENSVVNEMHPMFDWADRAIVKNFGGDSEQSIGFLKKRHPEFTKEKGGDISLSPDGGIIARVKGEATYKRLDPEGFDLQDITDVGADIVSGIGSGAATAAGGIAGNIPGAMAAGAASGAGLEALRQGIGKALGVNNGDMGDIAMSTAFGAASPLLFGSGASAKAAAKSAVKSLGADAGKEALDAATAQILKSQRGAAGIAYDGFKSTVAPKIGSFLSGAPEESIKTLANRTDEYAKLEVDPEGVLNLIDETGGVIDDTFRAAKTKTWDAFNASVDGAGDAATVDLNPVSEMFKDAIKKAKDKVKASRGTEASKELLERLEDAYQRYFIGEEEKLVPTVVEKASGLLDEFGKPLITKTEELVPTMVKSPNKALSPRAAIELEAELGDMAGFSKLKDKVAGNRFSGGDTKADKELMTLAAGLKKALAGQVDQVVPEGTLPLRKQYGELVNLEKSVDKLVQNPRQAFTNLRNADIASNITNKQLFHKIDRVLGTDLGERAKMAEAFETFSPGRKSFFSDLRQKSTIPLAVGAGALGAYTGSQVDKGGYGGAIIGGGLGGMAGAALGGPKAIRAYMQTQRNLSRMAEQGKALGLSPQAGAISIWNMLQDKDKKK